MVAARHELPEQAPVSRWRLRVRTVGPVLGNGLLAVGEPGADFDQLIGLLDVLRGSVFGRRVGRPVL
jgi:hypothetical protein